MLPAPCGRDDTEVGCGVPPSQAEERRKGGQALIPTPRSPAFPIGPFGCFQHTRNRTRTLDLSNGKATGVTPVVLHAFLQKDSGREELGCAGKQEAPGNGFPRGVPGVRPDYSLARSPSGWSDSLGCS